MSDPFALLGLPSRPWLDESAIRFAFQERARRLHPDAAGGDEEAFASLNAARTSVANPALRLRLLAGDTAIPGTPSDVSTAFRVAELSRRAGVLAEKAPASANVLVRTLLAREAELLRKDLEETAASLEEMRAALDRKLMAIDACWPDVTASDLASLAGEFVFLRRWQEQVREARLRLRIAFGEGLPSTA